MGFGVWEGWETISLVLSLRERGGECYVCRRSWKCRWRCAKISCAPSAPSAPYPEHRTQHRNTAHHDTPTRAELRYIKGLLDDRAIPRAINHVFMWL